MVWTKIIQKFHSAVVKQVYAMNIRDRKDVGLLIIKLSFKLPNNYSILQVDQILDEQYSEYDS